MMPDHLSSDNLYGVVEWLPRNEAATHASRFSTISLRNFYDNERNNTAVAPCDLAVGNVYRVSLFGQIDGKVRSHANSKYKVRLLFMGKMFSFFLVT